MRITRTHAQISVRVEWIEEGQLRAFESGWFRNAHEAVRKGSELAFDFHKHTGINEMKVIVLAKNGATMHTLAISFS